MMSALGRSSTHSSVYAGHSDEKAEIDRSANAVLSSRGGAERTACRLGDAKLRQA